MNAAIADAPAGRPPLLINMDETALGYHFGGLRGTILRQRADSSAAPVDRASLSDVRGHVSYLASICDDVTVQDLLPQVLLGNEHRFTKQVLHSMDVWMRGCKDAYKSVLPGCQRLVQRGLEVGDSSKGQS